MIRLQMRSIRSGRRRPILFVLVCLVAAGWVAGVAAADWPYYRGPERNGRSPETGLLTQWPEEGPKVLWRAELGDGYSGIVVSDGRVYTLYSKAKDELVVAFDAATGKRLWQVRIDENRFDQFGSGPRSSPVVEGGKVFALGALGKLVALEPATGKVLWNKDLREEFGARVPTWGISATPHVEGNLLLVDVGGKRGHSLMAFDTGSGEVRWAAESDKPGYSTPLPVEVAGVRQVLFFTGTSLVSVAPDDGKVYWRVPWKTSYDVNAAMPVFIPPDKVFVSSSYDVGAAVFKIERSEESLTAKEVWRSRGMKNHFNSSVLVGDHLYGFDDGTLKCIEAATGEEKWRQRGFAKGSLIYADGHLYILSEKGELAVAEANPEKYVEKGRSRIFQGRTWTMPSLSEGKLFVRSQKEIAALDLAG